MRNEPPKKDSDKDSDSLQLLKKIIKNINDSTKITIKYILKDEQKRQQGEGNE